MSDHIEPRCDDPSGFGDVIKIENAIPFNGETGPVFDIMCALTPIADFLGEMMKAMLVPVIGLPVINGENTQWLAFSAADNQPWNALIGQGGGTVGVIPSEPGMYWTVIVPVSIMVLLLATAFLSIRAGTLSRVRVQEQFRRIGVGFLTAFFWLPIASLALRFFHELTLFIAVPGGPSGKIVGLVSVYTGSAVTLFTLGAGGIALASFVGPIIALILAVAVIAALTIVVMRWVLVVMITVSMPLVVAFWAVDVWPLNHFSQLASRVTSVYAGLLVSGLPTAVLIRVLIGLQNRDAGFVGDIGLNIGVFEAVFDVGEPFVTLMVLFLPVFVFKSVIATTRMTAGMVATETATAGQQTLMSAGMMAATTRRNRRTTRRKKNGGSSKSSFTAKTNIRPVDTNSVLAAVRSIPTPASSAPATDVPSVSDVRDRHDLALDTDDGLASIDAYGLSLGGVQGVADRLEVVDDRLDTVETDLETIDDRVDRLRADATRTADRLDAVATDQRELRGHTGTVADRLDDLEDRVESVTSDSQVHAEEDPR